MKQLLRLVVLVAAVITWLKARAMLVKRNKRMLLEDARKTYGWKATDLSSRLHHVPFPLRMLVAFCGPGIRIKALRDSLLIRGR